MHKLYQYNVGKYIQSFIHTHTRIYMYVYSVCMCVVLCACVMHLDEHTIAWTCVHVRLRNTSSRHSIDACRSHPFSHRQSWAILLSMTEFHLLESAAVLISSNSFHFAINPPPPGPPKQLCCVKELRSCYSRLLLLYRCDNNIFSVFYCFKGILNCCYCFFTGRHRLGRLCSSWAPLSVDSWFKVWVSHLDVAFVGELTRVNIEFVQFFLMYRYINADVTM